MTVLFSNNASAALASSITNVATTIVLASGAGALFPSPGVGQWFYVTLIDPSNNLEIVRVTTRATDTLTVVRGQDSTTSRAYAAGCLVECRVCAAVFADFQASITPFPTGAVAYFAMTTPPSGWLVSDHSAVSRTTNAALFAVIGTTYGVGDGSTTFNLPEMRGEFIRGLDMGRGVDTGRTLGIYQADGYASHSHGVTDPGHSHSTHPFFALDVAGSYPLSASGGLDFASGTYGASTGITINAAGGTETRPRNQAFLACIKT